ncbi:hypothetical protein GLOIN_2v1773072 [Rhizophagus irregularis DAOM 181602=DAOM 197198]|nr:hypothetical protein GLOIN_2v1773072 [Rhizophagus irregularis DAOM 181602=DAOM 197198]
MNYQFTVTALTKVKKILSFKNVRIDSNTDTFKEMLVALLWYIDPHRNKLITWSLKLSDIFKELEQYQHNESYNKFYFIGHHKKEQLSHEKLEQLVKCLLQLELLTPSIRTENARVIAAINENLPKYYTRQMRKNALDKVTPAVL